MNLPADHAGPGVFRFPGFLIVLLCSLFLHSCSSDPQVFDRQVFHYNQSAGISSLDPAFARDQSGIWAVNQLYNGLVQLDDSLRVQPAIAYRWDISADGLIYTFHLRSDVYFHKDKCFDGNDRHVTASDVLYSLARLKDPRTASPGAWVFHDRVEEKRPFEAPDDSTFVLHLVRPFRPMLGILTMQYCSVIAHEAVEMYGPDFRSHPVGTGPFYLKVWREGSAMILSRNERYFEKENGEQLPHIKGVRISFMNSKKTEFVAFKQGKLDFISGIDASFQDEVLDENGQLRNGLAGKFNLSKTPYLNTEYLGFLMAADSTSAIHDKRVRQAINCGFDRNELIHYLRNGIGKPAENGFTPPGLPSFDAAITGYNYDPDKARQLLKDAGYGTRPVEVSLYTNDTYREMALMLSKQLEKVGIRLKVEVTEPAILREWMSQGKVSFFRGSWIADYPDAESYFTVFYSGNTAPPNYTHFHNATYDHIYKQSLQENNDSARYALYHQLEHIIINEAPVVPLYYDEVLRFTQKRVKGLSSNGLNLLDMKRVRLN
ncbi:MAG: transporter substrate-binding protein [Bacteroidetes bacterium]|nr:transporter substrate-binding protein [Bacteroidota bacterium]